MRALLLFGLNLLSAPWAVGHGLEAQGLPELQATRDLTVEGKPADLDIHTRLMVSPNGTIALAKAQAVRMVLINSEQKRIQVLGAPGEKPGAINAVGPYGWVGDSLWIMDTRIGRLTVFAPDRSVARIPTLPLSIDGPPGTTVADHTGMGVIVKAIYPDGQLLTEEYSIRALLTKENSRGYLLRSGPDGSFKAGMGLRYDGEEGCRLPANTLRMIQLRDFCRGPSAEVSINGRFLVTVRASTSGADSGRYSVTTVGERGDTSFTRSFSFTPIAVTPAELDSAMAWRVSLATATPHGPAAAAAPKPPASAEIQRMIEFARATARMTHPPVLTVLPGDDGTVWLELFTREPTRHWLELDATGKSMGTLTLPMNIRLMQGARATVWGREELSDSSINVVRYHIEGFRL